MMLETIQVVNGQRKLALPAPITQRTAELIIAVLYGNKLPSMDALEAIDVLRQTTTMRSIWKLLRTRLSLIFNGIGISTLIPISSVQYLFEFYVEEELTPHEEIAFHIDRTLAAAHYVSLSPCFYGYSKGKMSMATFISACKFGTQRLMLFVRWYDSTYSGMLSKDIKHTVQQIAEVARAIGNLMEEYVLDECILHSRLIAHLTPPDSEDTAKREKRKEPDSVAVDDATSKCAK